jgi:hypothetical protein
MRNYTSINNNSKLITIIYLLLYIINISKAQEKSLFNEDLKLIWNYQSYYGGSISPIIHNYSYRNIKIPLPEYSYILNEKDFESFDLHFGFSYLRFLKENSNEGSAISIDLNYSKTSDTLGINLRTDSISINKIPTYLPIDFVQENLFEYYSLTTMYDYLLTIYEKNGGYVSLIT